MQMPSATIKVFLVHGDPSRLRTAEISNWTGKAVAGPRSEFDEIQAREEASRSGVYLLAGIDDATGRPALYIGEGENVRERLKRHLSLPFWNRLVFFTSKDENLTKAHTRHLEGLLIEQARTVGRAVLRNGLSSGSKLPESDREDMAVFLHRILQLLPVLGSDAFVPVSRAPGSRTEREGLFCRVKGVEARGHLTPAGLLILKGSQAVLQARPSAMRYPAAVSQRNELIAEETLVQAGDHYVFTEDVEFSSPSAAAAVVAGGSMNGLVAWKNRSGQTLKELEGGDS